MAFLMWPSVQAMNLSCVNRSSSLTSLPIRAFSLFLSFFYSLSFRSTKLPFAALCGNPSEPTFRVISQQNLSIAGGNVFRSVPLPQCYHRNDSPDPFLILLVLSVSPFASRSVSSPCSPRIFMGSDSFRALVGELKFNGD